MIDYPALQVITLLSADLLKRANTGIFKPNDSATLPYLKGCRVMVPQLGSSFVLAYEDLRHVTRLPVECLQALHLATSALPIGVMRDALASGTRQIDEPSRQQRRAVCQTIFGQNYSRGWCRTEEHNGVHQFHAWVFVALKPPEMKWVGLEVPEGWPRMQGMRRLVEQLD